MKQSKKYRGTMAIAIVAMAFVGVVVMRTQVILTGDVINNGNTKTPTATDVILTMSAPATIKDKTRLTLRPNVKNVNNFSHLRAERIVVSMVLPPELTFDIASEAGCTVNDRNVVTCPQIDYLGDQQARSLTIHLKVNACQGDSSFPWVDIPVWTMVTTYNEEVNTASNIQQDYIRVTCPRMNQGSSSSMRSSASSVVRGAYHTECRTHSCVLVPGSGPDNCILNQFCNPDQR